MPLPDQTMVLIHSTVEPTKKEKLDLTKEMDMLKFQRLTINSLCNKIANY